MADLDDYETIRAALRDSGPTVAERRAKETRVPSYNSRRKMQKTDRTEQTNLKFSPVVKRRLIALASAAGETMVEYIERAIEMRAEREAKP